jgi:hypothetical protein
VDARAAGWLDDASAVLPPPREGSAAGRDELWHTASFAAIHEPPPRRGLSIGLAVLGIAVMAVGGYAGVRLAALGGLTPPSPPRYVLTEQAAAHPVVASSRQSVPRRNGHGAAGASRLGVDMVRILRSY